MSKQVAITLFLKKVVLNGLKLCFTFHYNITGRSQCQVLFFHWQGIGPGVAPPLPISLKMVVVLVVVVVVRQMS